MNLEPYYDCLMGSPLFKEITVSELKILLPCLKTMIKTCAPGEFIFTLGTRIDYIYIILEGKVEIAKENLAGQKNIVALLEPSQLFGEGIVCTNHRLSPVSSMAQTPTTLLLIPYENIIYSCSNNCHFHHLLVRNMMLLLGQKNYYLNTKLDLLMLKGMREKLVTYLLAEYHTKDTLAFSIPLNRNELAEYLNVSRPSMCRELGRMKDEGLIDYYQNSFKLINLEKLKGCLSTSTSSS